jgi:hypothetical protein
MKKKFLPVFIGSLILIMIFPITKTYAAEEKNLKIHLSYEPASPYNDPSGSNPMELKISSSILYATNDKNYINYNWKIYGTTAKKAVPATSASWDILTKPVDASPFVGFGLFDFEF